MFVPFKRRAHLGNVGLRIDCQLARDGAAADQRQGERLGRRHAVVDQDAEGQRLHRQIIRRDDLLGVERDVHVHRPQALGMERHVGKQIAGGFELLLGLLLLRRDVAGLARRRTDQRRQIGEDQVLRYQLGGEELGLLGLVDQDVAGEIAVADVPLGVDELPQAGLALELAADAIGRRRRSGNAQQGIDLRQVRTGEREIGVGAGPLEGILHGALQGEFRGAVVDIEIDRIGLLRCRAASGPSRR